MNRTNFWMACAAVVALAQYLPGCGPPDARHYPRQLGGTSADAGKSSGSGGMAPEQKGTGGADTGGSMTGGTGGGAGGASMEGTGGVPTSTGGVFGADPPDAAVATGGAGGALEPDAGARDLPGTGGAVGTGGSGTGGSGTGGAPGTGGQGGRDAGFSLPGDGTTAACHPDPKVIEICKQLEPACLNCPSNSARCFNVAMAGDDRACARYAVDNDCTVDVGGNWCGSLNCLAQGCDRTACRTAQGEGNSPACQKLLDKCPCR